MIKNGRILPDCVKSSDFGKLSDDAVGYTYKWTYLGPVEKVKGKYYTGRRKIRGNVEDYNHSSSHPQFKYYFEQPESEFHYEILYSSNEWSKVVNDEAKRLDKCVGVDPLCWNLQKAYKVPEENDKAVEELYEKIKESIKKPYNGPYEVTIKNVKELESGYMYQTRDTDYIPTLLRTIKNSINDSGNIDKTNPIITLEDRDESVLLEHDGGDLHIDGNNTLQGIMKSKHPTKAKNLVIPYDDHKFLSDLDVEALSAYLNAKKDPVVKVPNNLQKGVDYCISEDKQGNNYKSKRVKERLFKMGFDNQEVNKILGKAKVEIAANEYNQKQSKVLITYGDDKNVDLNNPVIKRFLEKHHTVDKGGTTMAKVIRSGNPILDRFLIEIVEQEDKWLEQGDDRLITEYFVGITHTNHSMKWEWDNSPNMKAKFERIQNHLENRGYKVRFTYGEILPVFRPKTKKI